MKIVQIVEGFGGGVYSFMVDLCNGLISKHDITLIYSTRPQTPISFKNDFNSEIKLVNLEMGRNINIIKDFNNLLQLIKIIKREKPDIVHLHSSKAGFLGRIACAILGYEHNNVFYNPHGYAFLQNNISKSKRLFYFYTEKFAAKFCGKIVAVSKGEYLETLKLTSKATRIDNSIDDTKLNTYLTNAGEKHKKLIIGTIGRITYQKNPKMFNEIAQNFPEVDFLWIGDGELRHELKSQNIKITGWMERYEAIKEMNKIDIYIQPSLWEGMPIALLEAMYMGKVPVVSNVIGNNDVVINEKNGFLCNDIEEYIFYISKLICDIDLRKTVSESSREHINQNYLLQDMICKYNNLYNNKHDIDN